MLVGVLFPTFVFIVVLDVALYQFAIIHTVTKVVLNIDFEQAEQQLWALSVLSALPRQIILSLLPIVLVNEMEGIRVVYVLLWTRNSSCHFDFGISVINQ